MSTWCSHYLVSAAGSEPTLLRVVDEYLELLDCLKRRLTFDEATGEGSIVELWPEVEAIGGIQQRSSRYYHHQWHKYVQTENNPDRLLRILNWSDRVKVLRWVRCSDELLANIDLAMSFVYSLIVYYDPTPIGRLSPDRLSDTISRWKSMGDSEKMAVVGYVDSRVSQR